MTPAPTTAAVETLLNRIDVAEYVDNADDVCAALDALRALAAERDRLAAQVAGMRVATAKVLHRVGEWVPPHVHEAGLGFGTLTTDCGEALNDLRKAARLRVVRNERGHLDFMDDDTRALGATEASDG